MKKIHKFCLILSVLNLFIPESTAQPDLIITSTSVNPTTVNVGNSITLNCSIKNQGSAKADFGILQTKGLTYFLSANSTYSTDDIELGNTNLNDFTAGETRAISGGNFTISSSLNPGNYYVLFYVDKLNYITESIESNNISYVQITVRKPTPDLIVLSPSASPSTVTTGNSITLSCSVKNQGDAIADFGVLQTKGISYFLSNNSSYSTDDVELGTTNLNDFAVGETRSISGGNFTIPSNTAAGTFYIVFYVDKSGYIAESNESNNTAISSAFTVVLPPPDLTVTSVNLSSGTVQAGNSVDVTYTVKNQGTGTSKAVSAGIYLSTTQTGTSTYLNRGSVPVLSAGGQSSLTTQVTIPSATTAGSYYIVIYADYTNAEPNEINESNNITGKAVTIIRFTVTGVSVTVTPSSLNEGEIMTKSVTITGTGGGTVNYRWEDKNPGSSTWNPIQDKTATMSNGSVSIPSSQIGAYAPAGTHYHRVVITGPNSKTSNEVGVNVIVPSPDLIVSSVSLNPSSVQSGNTVDVTFTAKNQGAGNSFPVFAGIYISTIQYGLQTYLDKVDVPLLASGGQSSFTKTVTIPSTLSAGGYFIDVFIDYSNEDTRESNETNNVISKAITVYRFMVTGVTVDVTPSSLNEGETMTKSVTITGTGSGTVNYRWEDKNPGSSTWNPIQDKTATMYNGSVSIPPSPIGAYGPAGTHYHRVVVTGPNSLISNEIANTVIVKITGVQETHPGMVNGNIIDLGISSDIIVDFTEDLNPATVNNTSVKLYRADNASVSYASSSETGIPLLRDSRIIINPTGNLEYGTLYILEIDKPLTDILGHYIDGDGNGTEGGKLKIGIQTEVDPNYGDNLKSSIETETDNYIPKITITDKRNDLWAFTYTLEDRIVTTKDAKKPIIQQNGISDISVVKTVIDGDLNYQVDGNIYHLANLRFRTNAGVYQNWNIVLDDNDNVVTDLPTIYKVLITFYNRNSRYDKSFIEANQDALNWVAVRQAFNDAFVLIRDGAVSVVFSLSANQIGAFIDGVVDKISTDLPSVFLSVFLHQYNAFLRNEFDLALAKANSQVYPMLNYNDASYYLYSEIILYSQNSLFMELTENVWDERANLSNQLMDVLDGARNAIADRLRILPRSELVSIIKTINNIASGTVLIKSLIDNYTHLHNFDVEIINKRQFITEQVLSPDIVSDCLLASEIWQGFLNGIEKIDPSKEKGKITVYPNPVPTVLTIEFEYENYKYINILNPTGIVMGIEKAKSNRQQIDLSGFEPGLYVLEFVKYSGETRRMKIIKSR